MAIYRCRECGAVNRVADTTLAADARCARCKRVLDTSGSPQPVDAAALVSAILSSPAPVLVGFCDPAACSADLDRLAASAAGRIVSLRVDTRAEPAAAEAYRISGELTFVLFSGGTEVARGTELPSSFDVTGWMARAASAERHG